MHGLFAYLKSKRNLRRFFTIWKSSNNDDRYQRIVSGKFTYGIENIKLRFGEQGLLEIGKYCSIADNLTVFLGGNHRLELISTFPFGHVFHETFTFALKEHPDTNGNVIIGHDVWIGSGVTIMSGVKVGSGSVIAANSHVVRDVAPYSIVGGNPAKFIKYRLDQKFINSILQLAWWDWCNCRINNFGHLFGLPLSDEIVSEMESAKIQLISHHANCSDAS